MKELKFIKELNTKNKMKSRQSKYLNDLESPVEIVIKVWLRLKLNVYFHTISLAA